MTSKTLKVTPEIRPAHSGHSLGRVPKIQSGVTKMKTNNFQMAIDAINKANNSTLSVKLAESANQDQLSINEMRVLIQAGLNAMMQDEHVILTGTKHNELALFSQFKKALQRHNTQVLWSTFRPMFESDGLTAAFLGHIKFHRGEFSFENSLSRVVMTAFTKFDAASNSMLALSAKNKKGVIEVEIDAVAVPTDILLAEYEAWKNTLDAVKPIESTANTVPDSTLVSDGTGTGETELIKQINTLQSQHDFDTYQIQSEKRENLELSTQIAALSALVERLQVERDEALAALELNAKRRKRAA